MVETGDAGRDLVGFVLPDSGGLVETADATRPYVLLDADGAVAEPVSAFFAELQACGGAPATIRSYGMDLLRWWRFLAGWEVAWNRATRADARGFVRWMEIVPKPARSHWRRRADAGATPAPGARPLADAPNQVTGRAGPGRLYSAATRAHCETVLRSFYAFHLEEGTGPIINPFPADGAPAPAGGGGAGGTAVGGRPVPALLPQRLPRRIPDDRFNELFAALRHHRDRALLAFWVSNGVGRASC